MPSVSLISGIYHRSLYTHTILAAAQIITGLLSLSLQVNFADIEPRKTQIVKSVPLRSSESSTGSASSGIPVSPLRKAVSVQNLKHAGQSIKRASSIDNLCRPTASSLQKNKNSSLAKTQVTIRSVASTDYCLLLYHVLAPEGLQPGLRSVMYYNQSPACYLLSFSDDIPSE